MAPSFLQGSAVPPLKQGACNYGASGDAWPSWHTAALGPGNRLLNDLPLGGCGACFEVQCGNGSAVQVSSAGRGGCGRCGAGLPGVQPQAGRRCRAGGQWGVGHTVADPCMRLPADCMALTVPRLIERFAAIPAPLQGSPCAASGNASIVVAVVDACPGCADDQLALHPLAVSQLAPLSREAIPVRYRQVRGLGVGGAGAGWAVPHRLGHVRLLVFTAHG